MAHAVFFGLIGFVLLLVIAIISVQNWQENRKLGKIWKEQGSKSLKDYSKCRECGYPQLYGLTGWEGLAPFISKKYYEEEFYCSNCGLQFKFIVRYGDR